METKLQDGIIFQINLHQPNAPWDGFFEDREHPSTTSILDGTGSESQTARLIQRLTVFMQMYSHLIREATLKNRTSGMLFLVVAKLTEYSVELEEALTDLDIEIAQSEKFSHIRLSVHMLPNVPPECYTGF